MRLKAGLIPVKTWCRSLAFRLAKRTWKHVGTCGNIWGYVGTCGNVGFAKVGHGHLHKFLFTYLSWKGFHAVPSPSLAARLLECHLRVYLKMGSKRWRETHKPWIRIGKTSWTKPMSQEAIAQIIVHWCAIGHLSIEPHRQGGQAVNINQPNRFHQSLPSLQALQSH